MVDGFGSLRQATLMSNAKTTTPAMIRRLERQMNTIQRTISDLRANLPEVTNSENEMAVHYMTSAMREATDLEFRFRSAARALSDRRTQAEIDAEQDRLRAEMKREEVRAATFKQFGCYND